MRAINANAPVKTIQQIEINASPEQVWALLSDLKHWENWNKSVSDVKLKGSIQAGTAFSWKSAGMKINSILHTVESPDQFGWTGKAMGTFAIHNWKIQQAGEHTLVIMEESMEGLLVKLLKKSLQKTLDKGAKSWLNDLKTAVEKAD